MGMEGFAMNFDKTVDAEYAIEGMQYHVVREFADTVRLHELFEQEIIRVSNQIKL